MAVLVTGAAGFIGRHVVRQLLADGHAVVGLDRRPWTPEGEAVVVTDLTHHEARAPLGRADAVVHLAGRAGVRDVAPIDHRWRWRDNVLAGKVVLDTVPVATALVVASSSSVYGGAGDPEHPRPCHEDAPLAPRGSYARSKAVLEQLVLRRRERGGAVTVVRPFTVAGEGQRPDMAISRWLVAARNGEPLPVIGGLGRRRDITDVRDVARGIVAALHGGHQTTINLGTGVSHSLHSIIEAVGDVVGVTPRLRLVPAPHDEPPATMACTRRCERLLGFVPRTDLPTLVARQAAAMLAPAQYA